MKMEGKKRERESGDGWVKERADSYTWCGGSNGQVYKVNHGGVSKRRDWANLHRGPAWAR